MKVIKLPKASILDKKELAEICGGIKYMCTCWNEDGTQTILEADADSPENCAALCLAYKKQQENIQTGNNGGIRL